MSYFNKDSKIFKDKMQLINEIDNENRPLKFIKKTYPIFFLTSAYIA
jgi:hypothetical protein